MQYHRRPDVIIIRKFQPSDFPGIIEIERTVFNEHDPYYYMQFYESCPEGFIAAEVDGVVGGYVVGFLSSGETGRIFTLAVRPEYQNRGIGGALLEELIDIFREAGAMEVILEVRFSNVKAKRFYIRHGFYETGIAERYYKDGENAFLMKFDMLSPSARAKYIRKA